MPSRLTLALAGAVLVLLAALYGTARWGFSQAAEADELARLNQGLTQEVQVLDERLRALPAELQRQRTKRKEAELALDQNPEWRVSAVPDAVADGLCARLRCAQVHPVPTPDS